MTKQGDLIYKKILLILISAIIISLLSFTIIILINTNVISFSKSQENEEQEGIIDVEPPSQDNEDAKNGAEESDDYLNPFNQSYKKKKMEDEHFRDYIHKMSHQKVIADEKWGFYKITEDRIDWLIQSLNETKANIPNEKTYEDILLRWKKGDFSEVDKDHNKVWTMQNGSIGEATGIMSAEEEKEYIENTPETIK